MARRFWSDEERTALMKQREGGVPVSHLKVPGRSKRACKQEYYRLQNPQTRPRVRRTNKVDCAIAPTAAEAAILAAPVKRPRYFHDADRFVTSRITSQGLTAGIFGDPPEGRSALDKRGR